MKNHQPILAAQFPVSISIQQNLETIVGMLDYAQPGDIVLFPEGAVSGYSHDLTFLKTIDPDELIAALDELQEQAQKRKIHLWVGSCIQEFGNWFNSAIGFTPAGIIHRYAKINLANHERGVITPGSDLPVFELINPNGIVKVGVQICREIRYPEQWGWLARQGAQVILHLNNAINDVRFLPIWRSHLISHAASNQRFVVSVNNAAPEQNCPTVAVSPQGWVIEEIISGQSAFFRVELDLAQVSDIYLNQTRRDVVAIDVPSQKDRRKITRSMQMEKLQADFDEMKKDPALFDEANLTRRTEALEFINMIEDMSRVRAKDRDLQELYYQAHNFRQRLEHINTRLFSKLRGQIQMGEYTPRQLRTYFDQFTDYQSDSPARPHYGYENLDGLVSGVFLTQPIPEETLEREYGMVRYQPTPASVILEMIDQVNFSEQDVFYDLGSGLGLLTGLVNLLTGVCCIGVEYQPVYCEYASQRAEELRLRNIRFINGDARDVNYADGTVFFMFNPFGGDIFDPVLEKLHREAQKRKIIICSYGASTPELANLPWLQVKDQNTLDEFRLAIFSNIDHTPK